MNHDPPFTQQIVYHFKRLLVYLKLTNRNTINYLQRKRLTQMEVPDYLNIAEVLSQQYLHSQKTQSDL